MQNYEKEGIMKPNKKNSPVNGNPKTQTRYFLDIENLDIEDLDVDAVEKSTKVISQKLDEVNAIIKEHGLANEFGEEPQNNKDGYFTGLSEDVWKRVYPPGEGRVKWMEFARPWRDAYADRASAYMRRAGAHAFADRWCRRCSVQQRGKDWDYEEEINNYARAIEDYINTVRLQWGNLSSNGEAFVGAVKNYLCASSRHREPTESQSTIRSKNAQKRNACVCSSFASYERCQPHDHRYISDGGADIPTFLIRQHTTDIFVTLQSACLCKAEASFEAKRYECAVEEYTKLIRLSPEDSHVSAWVYPMVYIDRANALLCLGKNDEAEADFEKALILTPSLLTPPRTSPSASNKNS
jgi:tetratricopeptide (TPR) repeat protein